MADILGLPTKRSFSDRLYRWKPLSILVETFGFGVLPFVAPIVEAKYRKLKKTPVVTKEVKFLSAVQVFVE
jgi:hypothetical protein